MSAAVATNAQPKTAAMTASDVLRALAVRWPASEYLTIQEAPQDAARQGRKLDALVLSLWASRGYGLDGVEIKVSYADWQRERDNAAKADWWWRHTNRFWVAAPTALAGRIVGELPPGWGLLACERDTKPGEVVKAVRRDAEPLPMATVVGLLRTASGSGLNALTRARDAGHEDGYRRGRQDGLSAAGEGRARADLAALTAAVGAFKDASGVDLTAAWSPAEAAAIGRMYAACDRWRRQPETAARVLRDTADRIGSTADQIRALAEAVDATREVSS